METDHSNHFLALLPHLILFCFVLIAKEALVDIYSSSKIYLTTRLSTIRHFFWRWGSKFCITLHNKDISLPDNLETIHTTEG